NIDPNASVICQVIDGTVRVLEEIVMSANLYDICDEFKRRMEKYRIPDERPYASHSYQRLPLTVYGDSPEQRSVTSNTANWRIVRELRAQNAAMFDVHENIASRNPPVIDRINCVNAMLRSATGACRLVIDRKCKRLAEDFEQVTWKTDANKNLTEQLSKADPK